MRWTLGRGVRLLVEPAVLWESAAISLRLAAIVLTLAVLSPRHGDTETCPRNLQTDGSNGGFAACSARYQKNDRVADYQTRESRRCYRRPARHSTEIETPRHLTQHHRV